MANTIEVDVLIEIRKASSELKRIQKDIKKFEKTAKDGFNNAGGAFDVFKGTLAATFVVDAIKAIGGAVIDLGKAAISIASQIEDLTTQIGTLVGSTEKAKDILEDLQEFSAKTPFKLTGLAEASKTLLAFGFETSELLPKMQQLGDVAAASGQDLLGVTRIFGQVAAAGKLSGERLLQFQERAIPIGPAIAKTMGVAESSVKDLVSAGKVDFATFEKAFASLSQEGGKFFGGMAKQSKTLSGVLSTLSDNIDLLLADFGDELLPIIKDIATGTIEWIQVNRDLIKSFSVGAVQLVVDVWDTLVTAIEVVINVIGGLSNILIGTLGLSLDTVKLGIDELSMAMVGGEGITGQYSEELKLNAQNLDRVKRATDEAAAAQKRIDAVNAEILAEEKTRRAERQQIIDDDLKAKAEKAAAEAAIELKLQTDLKAVRDAAALLEAERLALGDEASLARHGVELETTQARLNQIALLRLDAQIKEQKLLKNHVAALALIEKKAALVKQQGEKKTQGLSINIEKSQTEFKKKNLKDQFAATADGLGALTGLMKSENKIAFNVGKAAAIAQAAIRIPESAINAFNAMAGIPIVGPALGFAAAGAAVAAGLININRIRSQSPPSFQQGGIVPGGFSTGDNQIARVGSGEMILNRQMQENLLTAINTGNLGSQPSITIEGNLFVDSDTRMDEFIDRLNDRVEFGNTQLFATTVIA